VKVPRAHGRVSPLLPAFLLALAAACATSSGPPSGVPAAPAAAVEPELRLGEAVERELAPGGRHGYHLEVPPGSYLRVTADPRVMDVALTLLAPDGSLLAAADGPGGSKNRELLSLVAPGGGSCRLLVERKDDGPAWAYRLELEEQRPARAEDATLVRAEALLAEGVHLSAAATPEANRAALDRFERSLDLWRSLHDAAGEAEAHLAIGRCRRALQQRAEAGASYERALALARAAGLRRQEADALEEIGSLQSRTGDPRAALEHYQRALALSREIGFRRGEAKTLYNIGAFHMNRGDVQSAIEPLRQSLALQKDIGHPLLEADVLNGLGAAFWYMGDLPEALTYFQRGLELCRLLGARKQEAAVVNNLAAIHRRRGNLQQALELYERSLALNRGLGHVADEAKVLEAMGSLFQELGDLDRAAEALRQALAIYRTADDQASAASALTSLGWLEHLGGDTAAALATFGRALEIARAVQSAAIEGLARHRAGIAELSRGETAAAIASLEEALRLRRAVGNRSEEASVLLDLGTAHAARGAREEAERHYAEVLERAQKIGTTALEAACLLRWARLDRDRDALAPARERIERAVGIVDSMRERAGGPDLRATFFAAQRSYYDLLVDVLMRLEEQRPGEGFAVAAFEASERARARSLLELLTAGRIDVVRGIDPALKERKEDLLARAAGVQTRLRGELAKEPQDAARLALLRAELVSADAEIERLEAEIRARHPRYSELHDPRPLRAAELQRLVDGQTALLEYYLGEDASYLFVATSERLAAYRLPAAAALADQVQQLRRSMQRPERRTEGAYRRLAHQLYEVLLAPAAEVLARKPHLVIVPDRSLHLLAFESLLTAAGTQRSLAELPYLVRSHSLSYVPSGSVLAELRAADGAGRPGRKRLVAFADPVFAGPAGGAAGGIAHASFGTPPAAAEPGWRRLPESRREVEAIGELFGHGDATLYLGAEANEENVKRAGALHAERLHFATHGFVDERHPELSALVLSNVAGSEEDGVLQVREIFNLDLDADLIVLSACETGLGREVTGEGLVGLSRAFLYAGASGIMVSLWRVADVSSRGLMVDFYRRSSSGMGQPRALRESKLAMIEGARWAHPFYWAPFILVGSAGAPLAAPVTEGAATRLMSR
jgi:CHAT domain-containing protein/tetratricopeptide (TPR) repeat protein